MTRSTTPKKPVIALFNEHMTFGEVSAYLKTRGITIAATTLKSRHAHRGTCPPSAKIGRSRYFKKCDIDEWIDSRFGATKNAK